MKNKLMRRFSIDNCSQPFVPSLTLWYFQQTNICLFLFLGISFQSGKSNVSQTFQDWSCGNGCLPNLYCRLPRCQNIAFPEPFSKSGKVTILLTPCIYISPVNEAILFKIISMFLHCLGIS